MNNVAAIADEELTTEELTEVKRFTGQIVKFGCVLLPLMTQEEVEAEIYSILRPTWIKVCRGNLELEKAYPKVVRVIGDVLEILFDAHRAVERATR